MRSLLDSSYSSNGQLHPSFFHKLVSCEKQASVPILQVLRPYPSTEAIDTYQMNSLGMRNLIGILPALESKIPFHSNSLTAGLSHLLGPKKEGGQSSGARLQNPPPPKKEAYQDVVTKWAKSRDVLTGVWNLKTCKPIGQGRGRTKAAKPTVIGQQQGSITCVYPCHFIQKLEKGKGQKRNPKVGKGQTRNLNKGEIHTWKLPYGPCPAKHRETRGEERKWGKKSQSVTKTNKIKKSG